MNKKVVFTSVEMQTCLYSKSYKEKRTLKFCGSRLTRFLYSQNIQHGPSLGKCQEVPRRLHLIFLLLANQNRYANEVLNMCIWWRQTTWVVLVPITTHIPSFINVAHTELWIFDFLLLANQNRYANEVLNMVVWWRQTMWAVLVPITSHIPSFINVVHTELWKFYFFDISQSEQICKWGIRYVYLVTTDHVGSTCAPLLSTYQVLWKSVIVFSLESTGLPFHVDEKPTSVHTYTYIHTDRQRYKWKLSGPSSIAGSLQKGY